ncbi:MAG: bacteriochlorophyll 4-vinyl reductase, partial [Chloroflexaceae bacterium]|nr:bacteriochlorophyll 4-vinyl reductase [Chloroflexaceae bacterium]
HLPEHMIPEQMFYDLVRMLLEQLGPQATATVLRESGQRTADYLLAHRIPRPFQRLVRILPRQVGLTLLLLAISGNAWTFVGSGRFCFVTGRTARILLAHRTAESASLFVPAACSFYGSTFEHLLQVLIHPDTQVQPVAPPHVPSDLRCAYIIDYGGTR